MTVIKEIQSINLKTFGSAYQVKRQVYAFFAILAFKNALRGRKCINRLSKIIAQVKYINWHLDRIVASPSFREKNTFPGAIRPLIGFYNLGPLAMPCDKPLK